MINPYRPIPPRYRVTINGETLDGANFDEVIRQLRERGVSTETISNIAAAIAVSPDGAVTVLADGHEQTRSRRCVNCQGVGYTRWEAFVCGLAWLVAGLIGSTVEPTPCSKCGGTGRRS